MYSAIPNDALNKQAAATYIIFFQILNIILSFFTETLIKFYIAIDEFLFFFFKYYVLQEVSNNKLKVLYVLKLIIYCQKS